MIIYNKTWLDNLSIHDEMDDAHDQHCVIIDEVKAVKNVYPVGFYTPGVFIRLGLFLLTLITVQFSVGFMSFLLLETHITTGFGWALFVGIGIYVILELMVKKQRYYRSGVDDALLWMSFGALIGGYVWMVITLDPGFNHEQFMSISISVVVFILSLYLALRFLDTIMSGIACLSLLSIVFFSWKTVGGFGVTTMPFVMMVISGAIYISVFRLSNSSKAKYYENCLTLIQTISLVTIYLSCNYYVVDQLSGQLTHITYSSTNPMPFGWFFWIWTMALPFAYIIKGIYNKNTILLRVGILLVGAAIATFRYYYHILTPETALTLAGIILIALVYVIIKYLKGNKHGFTTADMNKADIMNRIKVEALITGETLGGTHTPTHNTGDRFGGGDFGGGGSGGSYQ